VARGLPPAALAPVAAALAALLAGSAHLEFLLRWVRALCVAQGAALQVRRPAAARRRPRALAPAAARRARRRQRAARQGGRARAAASGQAGPQSVHRASSTAWGAGLCVSRGVVHADGCLHRRRCRRARRRRRCARCSRRWRSGTTTWRPPPRPTCTRCATCARPAGWRAPARLAARRPSGARARAGERACRPAAQGRSPCVRARAMSCASATYHPP